jgi:hypothetical protein
MKPVRTLVTHLTSYLDVLSYRVVYCIMSCILTNQQPSSGLWKGVVGLWLYTFIWISSFLCVLLALSSHPRFHHQVRWNYESPLYSVFSTRLLPSVRVIYSHRHPFLLHPQTHRCQISALTLWRGSLSKCYLRIQSVPQREHHTSPLQRSTS